MLAALNPRGLSFVATVLAAYLLMGPFGTRPAFAQSPAQQSDPAIQQLLQEMELLRKEVKYLRERDAQRQAWEHSVGRQIPQSDLGSISQTNLLEEPSETSESDSPFVPLVDSTQFGCDSGCCDGCDDCGCDAFYSCLCPTEEAPCIECPHVSTLNPYFNVNLFGALKLDMLFSGARPIAAGTPFFLTPDSLTGLSQNTVDIHARQSTIGAAFTGPQLGSFQSGGLVMAMFYNDAIIVDQYGFLPLQAYGELRNQDWRFAAGLQFDVFSPGLPTVLPFSALAATGNSGNSFRGQVRLERFLYPTDDSQWTLQAALSEPITTTIDPAFGLSEDNGWPNVEGRIAWSSGPVQGAGLDAKRPLEVGVSGVVGQIRTTRLNMNALVIERVIADVWGLSSDFRWKINDVFGVMGEFYTGQTLGNYNGGILQSINPETLHGVRTTGGWFEVFAYLTPCLHNHTGYGIDDPLDRDLVTSAPGLARVRNTVFYSNLIWDLNASFRIGFEFTWRETDYLTAGVPDNEGPGFHTQFQWAF